MLRLHNLLIHWYGLDPQLLSIFAWGDSNPLLAVACFACIFELCANRPD
jgi:hypothetical protein